MLLAEQAPAKIRAKEREQSLFGALAGALVTRLAVYTHEVR